MLLDMILSSKIYTETASGYLVIEDGSLWLAYTLQLG